MSPAPNRAADEPESVPTVELRSSSTDSAASVIDAGVLAGAIAQFVERAFAPLRQELDLLKQQREPSASTYLPRVLSVDQASRELGVSRSTFYALVADESTGLADALVHLPGVSGTRVDRDRLMKWIDRRAGVAKRRHRRRSG